MMVSEMSPFAPLCEIKSIKDNDSNTTQEYLKAKIDISSYSSISSFNDFSVIIDNNGHAFGIGNNKDEQIHPSLPKKKLTQLTEIKIFDLNNKPMKFISASCSYQSTIYLLSDENENKKKVFISKYNISQFLNLGKCEPESLSFNSIINKDGSFILIFDNSNTNDIDMHHYYLKGEKAVKIAQGYFYYFALGSKGNIHILSFYECEKYNYFKKITYLKEKFIDISGTWQHTLAITENGEVYGCGEYYHGQLGIYNNWFQQFGCLISHIEFNFIKIETLRNIKAIAVFAGGDQSIVLSDEKIAYSFGNNEFGQLMMPKTKMLNALLPKKIKIDNVVFCIAGLQSSAILVGDYVPKNSPDLKLETTNERYYCILI